MFVTTAMELDPQASPLLLGCIFLLIIASSATSSGDSLVFNGFRAANMSIDGAASVSADGLVLLTNRTNHVIGHAIYTLPLTFAKSPSGNAPSFSTTFVFAMFPQHPTLGSSGFAFTLSPSLHFPGAMSNEYLGIFNTTNNGNTSNHVLAVELDTNTNPDVGDINANHVGVDVNSVISTPSRTAGYFPNSGTNSFHELTLISGEPMQAWIEYDGNTTQLNVTLSPLAELKPDRPLISTTVDLSGVLLDNMYAGFSSSTGVSPSIHYILGWSLRVGGKAEPLDLTRLPMLPRTSAPPKKKRMALIVSLPFATLTLIVAFFASIAWVVVDRNRYAELVEDWELEFGHQRFSYKDLYKATKGFDDKRLLGAGGFGRVYKGVLRLPTTPQIEVAVKRVSHGSRQGVKEFVAEIASIGQLRHRNLVQLLGYCRRREELLLVYDYMPNSSLDKLLFDEGGDKLDWAQRFRIIKGVASGLLYLHEDWDQVVVHRDVKASNVLLDCQMNARLGDFGLARLYDHGTDPHTTHIVGTVGYLAPEFVVRGKATTGADVFAFGVLTLEIACGRRPISEEEEEMVVDMVYQNWVDGALLGSSDPRLCGEYVAEEMELVLQLGLMCSHPSPVARPSMRQVMQQLDGDVPCHSNANLIQVIGR